MSATFCQICRHPTDQGEGHFKNCPVYTGETVQGGISFQSQIQAGAIQQQQGGLGSTWPNPMGTDKRLPDVAGNYPPRPQGMGWIPIDDGYEVAKIYKEARERLLEELKIQVEINRKLASELLDTRLRLAEYKMSHP
jgi:hypothetical protein